MTARAAWIAAAASLVGFRPGVKVAFVGDSITAGPACAWQQEVINHGRMLYGDAFTPTAHGTGGAQIASAATTANIAAAVADAADIVIFELGVNDMNDPAVRPTIAAAMLARINEVRAALPLAEVAVLSIWCGHTETLPNPDQALLDAVNLGLGDACAAGGAQYIDVNSVQVADSEINNPTNAASGCNTLDGTHPNWRGRPLEGRSAALNLRWPAATYPDIDNDPSWTPSTDVTPSFFIEADELAPGLVSSWGPFVAAGAARPTAVPGGWFNGGQCVRFDGVQNFMHAALSTAAGAKTLFAVYRLQAAPAGFGNFCSLLTLTNGVVTSEFIPAYTGGVDPAITWCADQKKTGADGFFETGTNDVSDSSGFLWPTRFGSTFTGGVSTDPAQYRMRWGGAPVTPVQGTTFLAQALTCLCALGARVEDGVTPTNFAQIDVAAIGVIPSVLPTPLFYRFDQYLRRKWGP